VLSQAYVATEFVVKLQLLEQLTTATHVAKVTSVQKAAKWPRYRISFFYLAPTASNLTLHNTSLTLTLNSSARVPHVCVGVGLD